MVVLNLITSKWRIKMIEITTKNLDKEIIKSKNTAIIDFWAEWCMPCKMMTPIFEELSKFYGARLKFAKVNTEENQEIATQFGISGIPTLLIFNKGEVIDRIVGFTSKEELKEKIDSILSKIK
jgi:thioredoxin 1